MNAVCDECGPSDVLEWGRGSEKDPNAPAYYLASLLGGRVCEHKDLGHLASPITHVRPDAPPFLILHGEKDDLVYPSQSERLHQALIRTGATSTLKIFSKIGHGIDAMAAAPLVDAYFDRHLM